MKHLGLAPLVYCHVLQVLTRSNAAKQLLEERARCGLCGLWVVQHVQWGLPLVALSPSLSLLPTRSLLRPLLQAGSPPVAFPPHPSSPLLSPVQGGSPPVRGGGPAAASAGGGSGQGRGKGVNGVGVGPAGSSAGMKKMCEPWECGRGSVIWLWSFVLDLGLDHPGRPL